MNPETLPSFNILATGKDGIQITSVSDNDWNNFVNIIIANAEPGTKEWYTMDIAQVLHNISGKGYFPQGVTIENRITIREGAKSNFTLLAHEYGHALDIEHSKAIDPDIMNPVDWMRKSDKYDLKGKFQMNFPNYYKTFISASQNHLTTGVILAGLGWLYLSS